MDITNQLVKHQVFGTGKVISQNEARITIQFVEETEEKRFIYPDAFEKYLTISDPAVAQNVQADLTAKTKQMKARQEIEDEPEPKSQKITAPAAQQRKNPPKAKVPKTKIKADKKSASI